MLYCLLLLLLLLLVGPGGVYKLYVKAPCLNPGSTRIMCARCQVTKLKATESSSHSFGFNSPENTHA